MKFKIDRFSATSPNPVLRADKDGTALYSNEAGKVLLHEWGVEVGEKLPLNIRALVQKVISLNSPEKMEVKVGKKVYLTVFHPFYEEKCVCISGFDISDQKGFKEKLRESEEKYRNIVETANEGIYAVDAEAKITYVNRKLTEMLGYSLEESIGRPMWNFLSEENKAIVELNLEKRRQGIDDVNEFIIKRKDGSPIWTLVNAKPIFENDGKFMGTVCMLTDITERKEAEQALANIELARKKEIHHRIKNNLQVISSLLDLQAEKFKDRENIKDSEVLDAFKESQSRVRSMALIHEELHRGGGFENINFSAYIEKLADNLLSTYRLGNTDISLNRDLEGNFYLDMDTAIPLGMIVNELISNSFKHAFSCRDKGEIRIKLYREGKGNIINFREESKFEDCKSTSLILSVSDNGVGIPENFDIENLDSFGLQLVTSLVEQLNFTFRPL
jgi:PAS domain S-box-containing protein